MKVFLSFLLLNFIAVHAAEVSPLNQLEEIKKKSEEARAQRFRLGMGLSVLGLGGIIGGVAYATTHPHKEGEKCRNMGCDGSGILFMLGVVSLGFGVARLAIKKDAEERYDDYLKEERAKQSAVDLVISPPFTKELQSSLDLQLSF